MATAVICEFNPFHNGHKYLIEKAKKITGAENAIIVCSGNYVQRGMPAFYDKSLRTKAALRNGADVVLDCVGMDGKMTKIEKVETQLQLLLQKLSQHQQLNFWTV